LNRLSVRGAGREGSLVNGSCLVDSPIIARVRQIRLVLIQRDRQPRCNDSMLWSIDLQVEPIRDCAFCKKPFPRCETTAVSWTTCRRKLSLESLRDEKIGEITPAWSNRHPFGIQDDLSVLVEIHVDDTINSLAAHSKSLSSRFRSMASRRPLSSSNGKSWAWATQ
jgi:hypothetical protein